MNKKFYARSPMQESRVQLNDLPLLSFEKILSYPDLEDRIKRRLAQVPDDRQLQGEESALFNNWTPDGVRSWKESNDQPLPRTSSTRPDSSHMNRIFSMLASTILFRSKRLRFFELKLDQTNGTAFVSALISFAWYWRIWR